MDLDAVAKTDAVVCGSKVLVNVGLIVKQVHNNFAFTHTMLNLQSACCLS